MLRERLVIMRIPVFSRGITHLTDARYFAALGVDFMCFDMKQVNASDFFALIEWVEGPEIILENTAHHTSEYKTLIPWSDHVKDLPSLFVSIPIELMDVEHPPELPTQHAYIFEQKDMVLKDRLLLTYLNEIFPKGYIFFQFPEANPEFAELCAEEFPNIGIVLQGSSEKEVGLKNFDNLDKLIQILEYEH